MAAMALAAISTLDRARADGVRIGAALELLELESIEPTEDGFEVTMQIEEDELAELGLQALDHYLRANQPRLFSGLSFGLVRYENARVVPRELRVRARPGHANLLDVDMRADVIADKQKRELVCEAAGWKSSCDHRWVDSGTGPIAALSASGEVLLAVRGNGKLSRKPLSAEVLIRRTRGSLKVGGLASISLAMNLDPPYRAEKVALGLPPSARSRLAGAANLALREMRVTAAPGNRIQIAATVGTR